MFEPKYGFEIVEISADKVALERQRPKVSNRLPDGKIPWKIRDKIKQAARACAVRSGLNFEGMETKSEYVNWQSGYKLMAILWVSGLPFCLTENEIASFGKDSKLNISYLSNKIKQFKEAEQSGPVAYIKG